MLLGNKIISNLIDNIYNICSSFSNNNFITRNNNYWLGEPCNPDLLLHKNSTTKFLFDYEEIYFNNFIANNPNHRYYKKDFSYTLDNNAFRKYKLPETTEKILCLGCSNTFGFGLADDETWPYLLSKKLNFMYYPINLGLIGGSADTISRVLYQTMKLFTPKSVFILFPGIYRKEYITTSGRVVNFNVATASGEIHKKESQELNYDGCKEAYSSYLQLTNPNESFFNFIKNFKFIELTLNRIPFVWGTTCKMLSQDKLLLSKYLNTSNMIDTSKFNDLPNYYARDGEHYSHNYNEWVSDKFYELYKKNYL